MPPRTPYIGPPAPAASPEEANTSRFDVLVQLMTDLRSLGRGSWLALPALGEPVLYVRVRSRARSMAVLACQEPRGGWSYLWDGRCMAPADGTKRAARQIAAVEW
ncbi:hypothetical protein GCM10022214_45540 [Actinomadura miaoliensis]|uniref:Uncharacterized protein n=1 Tax=Actinomadura miaoliensis TaxID=430685 RepID=A0ABP7W5W3_9ACTN